MIYTNNFYLRRRIHQWRVGRTLCFRIPAFAGDCNLISPFQLFAPLALCVGRILRFRISAFAGDRNAPPDRSVSTECLLFHMRAHVQDTGVAFGCEGVGFRVILFILSYKRSGTIWYQAVVRRRSSFTSPSPLFAGRSAVCLGHTQTCLMYIATGMSSSLGFRV